ncbi:ATP-grasp domain-containing protein [Paenibacillus sp. GCM10028914]|uniref:ATP-grasp domain-containing protein n=1 Tax=Paenibacillus sp. GCM10028914 TaxID=3273416 RepID=UPI00360AF7E7
MKPVFMVVGGNRINVSVIEKAKEIGMRVMVVHTNVKSPGSKRADIVVEANPSDLRTIEKAASHYKVIGCMTRSEEAVSAVCKINERMHLPNQGVGIGESVTNKYLMRQCFKRAGVSCPQPFYIVEPGADLYPLRQELTEGLKRNCYIVKPTDSAGSNGVTKISDIEQLKPAIHAARKFTQRGRVIVEQFVEGIEIGAQCFSIHGEMVLCLLSRKTLAADRVSIGHSFPLLLPEHLMNRIKTECGKALQSLGIVNGPSNIDLILDDKGTTYILEVGARIGGTRLPEIVKAHSGIDLVEASIRLAAGQELHLPVPIQAPVAGLLLYFDQPNKIKYIRNYTHLLDKYKPLSYSVNIKNQMSVSPEQKNCGYVLCTGVNAKAAEQNCTEFIDGLKQLIDYY